MPQPRNRLENGRSTNDKISRRVWKDIKNRKTKKARITETKNERGKEEEIQKTNNRGRNGKVEEKEKERDKKEDLIELRTVEEIVPRWFHKYLKVFEKKKSEKILTNKTWDYVIDLREGFILKKEKIYPLLRVEREEVQDFVKNQLRKKYIRPLKSLQTSLMFFMSKKDSKKRMVQNYQYMNS